LGVLSIVQLHVFWAASNQWGRGRSSVAWAQRHVKTERGQIMKCLPDARCACKARSRWIRGIRVSWTHGIRGIRVSWTHGIRGIRVSWTHGIRGISVPA